MHSYWLETMFFLHWLFIKAILNTFVMSLFSVSINMFSHVLAPSF